MLMFGIVLPLGRFQLIMALLCNCPSKDAVLCGKNSEKNTNMMSNDLDCHQHAIYDNKSVDAFIT